MPPAPLAPERLDEIARMVGDQVIVIDEVWDRLTPADRETVRRLSIFYAVEARDRHEAQYFGPPQKRAKATLRSLLTPEQRRELRTRYGFKVRGSEGGVYRLYPGTGHLVRVREQGGRWYEVEGYCFHEDDPRARMPPADRSIAQMCLLLADEGSFLDQANARVRRRARDGYW